MSGYARLCSRQSPSTGRIFADTSHLQANSLHAAQIVKVNPMPHRGQPEMTPLLRNPQAAGQPDLIYFSYQKDKFIYNPEANAFAKLAYPCDKAELTTIGDYQALKGLSSEEEVEQAKRDYGKNYFDIPVPTFKELFAEHAVAPFFVFQVFCVGLWCLDEYWYYSLFTLFMLVVFECTVVFQVGGEV